MNNYERLEGMVAATFTPMDENGDVNLSVIEKYADWIASTPIKGVFVCGTTGEFSSLTIDERKLILEKWVASAGKRFKVIAHVGSNCQRSAMELACHAEKAGADAIASIAPSFFKPGTVDELIDFFAPVCRSASGLPFYYYNMPSITGVNLPVSCRPRVSLTSSFATSSVSATRLAVALVSALPAASLLVLSALSPASRSP